MSAAVLVFIAAAVACLAAHVAILVSVVRRASQTVDPKVPRPRLIVEVVWALIPAIVLAFVLTATWNRVRDSAPAREAIMKVAE